MKDEKHHEYLHEHSKKKWKAPAECLRSYQVSGPADHWWFVARTEPPKNKTQQTDRLLIFFQSLKWMETRRG